MGVILRELAHPHQTVKHPGLFVAVNRPQFEIAQRQIAVGADLRLVDQHVGEAVHRLDAVGLLIHLGEVHVLPVVIEVARPLPEIRLEDLGTDDDVVTALEVFLPLPVLDDRAQQGAFGVPDDQPRARLVVELEEIQFPAETAVVPLFRLFQEPQMFVERLLRRETGPVDALEHLVVLVPPPVGAGHVEELEGPDHPRRGDMGSAAEIDIAALGIEADRLHIRRQIVDQLDLVVLPFF